MNTSNWQYATGTGYPGGPANWGTGEIETMTDSTATSRSTATATSRITPRRDAAGNWTSGRIETSRTDFQPPAGGKLRVEGRLQMPNVTGAAAKGYWPAFWMLGAPYRGDYWNWPSVGEMDIMENTQGRTPCSTMHCGTSPGGPCNETSGIGGTTACPGGCQAGFHTYAVEWDSSASPEEIRFYVDGNIFHTVKRQSGRRDDVGERHQPRLLHHPQRGDGRRLPGRVRRRPGRRHPARPRHARGLRPGASRPAGTAPHLRRPAAAATPTAPSRPSRTTASPAP